jgi:hypothetical protein
MKDGEFKLLPKPFTVDVLAKALGGELTQEAR